MKIESIGKKDEKLFISRKGISIEGIHDFSRTLLGPLSNW